MTKAVYRILNKVNGKSYLGSSVEVEKRIRSHRNMLKNGIHTNKFLQNDFEKFGAESFEFIILETVAGDKSDLIAKEQEYLDAEFPQERLYNIYPSAKGSSRLNKNPMQGRNHTKESRNKMSENTRNFKTPEQMAEVRKNVTKRFDGRKHTEATKEKMSVAHRGREKSAEECRKLSENNGNNGAITIDGVYYRSHAEASRILGISRTTITSRVNNPKFTNYLRYSESVETNCKPEISAG